MEVSPSHYLSLPPKPGVYLFLDQEGEVLYVGKAKDLKKRVSSYFFQKEALGDKTKLLVSKVNKIRVIEVESELESLLLEANLIKKHFPKFNTKLTDGKAYPLIKITKNDKYPKVLLARKIDDKNATYFGPFPSSKTVKIVLKTVRRIFPFQAVNNHPKRICLYHHLNLCPCPTVFDSSKLQKDYKKTINQLIKFLEGNKKTVLKELEEERNLESKNENFEKASKIQNRIDAINYVTNSVHKPFEYVTNPNLREDLRNKELDMLKNHLNDHGVKVEKLTKIECFDISNFAGTKSVGSMVVFVNGEKESSLYRRFKINPKIIGPNDFAMMQSVLERRLKHLEWAYPNLIIVDGGKGQISSAKKALQNLNVKIPIIGLAKRDEIIITEDFKEIKLKKDSSALHLIQRIRDEAHRFAITYHRKLRSKFLEESS